MEYISELQDGLNAYFGWNKARMAGRKFLATNLDEKWKKSTIMFTY